ncbi:MAG TPA: cytochrome c oxidase subunit 4 [Anaerolineales bacterium]|nr:cytochrome c oxidase subunit 4 [Anaerolineales bacterium]
MNEDLTTPTYSFWPIFLAFSIVLVATGIVSAWGISILGLLLLFASIIGWVWESRSTTRDEND